jgi:peptidoglycan/LPS O-acetylase OafA/YrhL
MTTASASPAPSTTTSAVPSVSARLLAPFARVTGAARFIAEIDGLRFVAISTVLLFHLAVDLLAKAPERWAIPGAGLLRAVVMNGFHGVEIFFVVSGFVLSMPYAAHHLLGRPAIPLGAYLLRRLTRLEPPYLLSLAVMFALLVVVKGQSASGLLPHLGASAVYLHNLVFREESPINNVAWSLEVEIQFYALVPLLSHLFAIRSKLLRRGTIAALAVASVLLEAFVLSPGQLAWLTVLRFGHFFLAGFLLADLYLTDWGERPAHTPAWDLVTLAGWPALVWTWTAFGREPLPGEHPALLPAAAFPVLALLLAMAAFRGRWTSRLLSNPWLTAYGGMCYSIYLVHNPVFGVVLRLTNGLSPFGAWEANFLLQALVVLPLASIPAAIFFLAIEKPCMRRDWPQRLWGRLTGRAAA